MAHRSARALALPIVTMAAMAIGGPAKTDAPAALDDLNVVWESPSEDHHGSMPLGNGEIGLNAWADPEGDVHFYIGRLDSWSAGGHLLKVGKVRVSLSPSPLTDGAEIRQTLDLRHGRMTVAIDGPNPTELRLWVDANHPVIHLTSRSEQAVRMTAHIESWRTEPYTPAADSRVSDPYSPLQSVVQPDVFLQGPDDRIGWYHYNAESFGPKETMEFQGLDGYEDFVDILANRVFGAVITAEGGRRVDKATVLAPASDAHRLNVYCLARHPSDPADWLRAMEGTIEATESVDFDDRASAHEEWWRAFWDRSWIFLRENEGSVQRAYPANEYALRVGMDQHGGNVFQGDIGRLGVYGEVLSPEQVRELAATPSAQQPAELPGQLYSGHPDLVSELDGSAGWDGAAELTLEAWIRPEGDAMIGRIVDKVTPGQGDGFLFDTYPGSQLRVVAGQDTLNADRTLPAGEWTHVAAVIGLDGIRLYQSGDEVAAQPKERAPDAYVVSRAYALQRFINACAGRAEYPIKFNGSIFTVPHEGHDGNADYRRWGPGYWWQNTRLPYISMCASGDFDLLQPLFDMYVDDVFPLSKYRVEEYFGFRGAYFPECIFPWGAVFPDTYGHDALASEREDKLQRSGYHKWEWVAGPELVDLMLDYGLYTGHDDFTRSKTLPVARSIAEFFQNYYEVDDSGELVMHPSQALETWWDTTNPMPELAGLIATTDRILALPDDVLGEVDRPFWVSFRSKLPNLPLRETPDGPALAPAERYEHKANIENPELYAVYPFRLVAVGNPHLEWGINALRHRWDRGASGWRQDDIFMAYLGLEEEARDNIVQRARSWHSGSRFPAFWGPNYDWVPDQDHGGVLLKAVQSLLMQVDGDTVYLLPAWPEGWDADFKLHAPRQTVIEASIRDGKVASLTVDPPERASDVVIWGQAQ